MKPITKNITVTDEDGNLYDSTYPKRARGLVKHGRARFVDETTICLARPPDNFTYLEDEMSELNISPANDTAITLSDILARIDAITNDKLDIVEPLKQIENIARGASGSNADCAGEEASKALGEYLSAREATKQRELELLGKMYDDLRKPQRINDIMELNDTLKSILWDELGEEEKSLMRKAIKVKYGIYTGE